MKKLVKTHFSRELWGNSEHSDCQAHQANNSFLTRPSVLFSACSSPKPCSTLPPYSSESPSPKISIFHYLHPFSCAFPSVPMLVTSLALSSGHPHSGRLRAPPAGSYCSCLAAELLHSWTECHFLGLAPGGGLSGD